MGLLQLIGNLIVFLSTLLSGLISNDTCPKSSILNIYSSIGKIGACPPINQFVTVVNPIGVLGQFYTVYSTQNGVFQGCQGCNTAVNSLTPSVLEPLTFSSKLCCEISNNTVCGPAVGSGEIVQPLLGQLGRLKYEYNTTVFDMYVLDVIYSEYGVVYKCYTDANGNAVEYAEIVSRTNVLKPCLEEYAVSLLNKTMLDPSKLQKIRQTDCTYDSNSLLFG
jgi:hypothetical protein